MSSEKQLFFTNYQKILKYLVGHPSGEYTEREIQEATLISRAGVNFALRDLAKDDLVTLQKRGNMSFFSVSLDNPIIRQIKVVINLLDIEPVISSIRDVSEKIILFGSCATGVNIEESDIDLFVLSNSAREVTEIINKSEISERIQLVTKKPVDFAELKKKDPIFFEEISRGLSIWEKKNE